MTPQVTRYPLVWPEGWKRTAVDRRKRGRFRREKGQIGMPSAMRRLEDECRRFGMTGMVLSTNVELNLSGTPHGNRPEPADPGAALYFVRSGQGRVFACDVWTRTADNVAAIAAHLDALRRIDRYGIGTLDQAIAGYAPRLQPAPIEWWLVLGIGRTNSTRADIDRAFTTLAKRAHPDAGGAHGDMARLSEAKAAVYRDVLA